MSALVAGARVMVWQATEEWPDQAFVRLRTGLVHALESHLPPTMLCWTLCGRSGWIDAGAVTADHTRVVLDDDDPVCLQCSRLLAAGGPT